MTYERPSKSFTVYVKPAVEQLQQCSPLGNASKRANQVFERYLHIITSESINIPLGYIDRLKVIWKGRVLNSVDIVNLEMSLVDPTTLRVRESDKDLKDYLASLNVIQRYMLVEQVEWTSPPYMVTETAREKRVTMAQDSRAKNLTLDDLREHYSAHFTEELVPGGVRVVFSDASKRKFKAA